MKRWFGTAWLAALAVVVGLAGAGAAARRTRVYAEPQAALVADDRREGHFRDFGYAATKRMEATLLQRAGTAPDAATRARWIAALARLQMERGLENQAQAAAAEALRLGGADPEVRGLLDRPFDPRALGPVP